MEASQEYVFALNLIRKFESQLREIADSEDPDAVKPLVEAVKYPITGAMAQIKEGRGPLRDELLRVLAVVVAEFREPQDPERLRKALKELLSLALQDQTHALEGK